MAIMSSSMAIMSIIPVIITIGVGLDIGCLTQTNQIRIEL